MPKWKEWTPMNEVVRRRVSREFHKVKDPAVGISILHFLLMEKILEQLEYNGNTPDARKQMKLNIQLIMAHLLNVVDTGNVGEEFVKKMSLEKSRLDGVQGPDPGTSAYKWLHDSE